MSNYTGKFNPDQTNNNWSLAFDCINKGSKVLDVGCSSGNFGEALKYFKGCTVDGVEPDKGDYELAKKKLDKVYNDIVENLVDGELKNKKYDTLVFLDVVEHLFDPVGTLKQAKKLLKPSGGVVFSIPNMGHASVRMMLMKGDFEYGKTGILDNTHLHYYTEKEINRVFNQAGYKIKKMTAMTVGYSHEDLARELKNIGVDNPDSSLLQVLSSNNSHVYQYVGLAVPSKDISFTGLDREFQSPEAKKYFEDNFRREIEKLNNLHKIETLNIKEQLRAAKSELVEISNQKNSKDYRLGRLVLWPLRRMKFFITRLGQKESP